MRLVKIWLIWLPLICSCWLAIGWINLASATVDEPQASSKAAPGQGEVKLEGRGEGFKPEGKEEAQEEGKKEEAKEDECPATFGPIITDTAIPIDKGQFAVQPTFGLGFVTGSLTRSWRRVSAGGDFKSFGMDWRFTYGLWNNLEVFVVVPYVHNWASSVNEPGPNGERSANFGGLGDVNLTFKYRLVEETEVKPTVTALFATDFPSGHFKRLNPGRLGADAIGGGAYVFTTGLNLSKYVKPFIFYGNLWYSMQTAFSTRGEDAAGNSVYFRNYPRDFVTLNLAAEYPLTKKWVALLELTSFWDGGRLFGHQANVTPAALVSVMPGIEYMATEKFSLALGVNIDLLGKNADATVTPLLSMVHAF
jgi:hypothetical protein